MVKRILIVTPSYPPYRSGAATYFSNLVDALSVNSDLNFFILTTRHKNSSIILKKDRITIYRFIPNFIESTLIIRLIFLPLITFFTTLYICLIHRINLIHTHSSSAITMGVSLVSAIFRVPIILDVQDLMVLPFILKLGKIKTYIATGNKISNLINKHGIQKNKILVINSIPPPNNKNINLPEKKLVRKIIFVGSINYKIKGLDLLLNSINKLVNNKNDDLKLNIIGTGVNFNECKKFIEQNNLSNNIKLLGEKSNYETLQEIANSDLLILPSLSEGIPRVILESFMLKTPVIATNIGGIPEIIKDGVNGLLIKENSEEAITQAILKLKNNQQLVNLMVGNAFNYIKKLDNWEQLSKKIIQCYNK